MCIKCIEASQTIYAFSCVALATYFYPYFITHMHTHTTFKSCTHMVIVTCNKNRGFCKENTVT